MNEPLWRICVVICVFSFAKRTVSDYFFALKRFVHRACTRLDTPGSIRERERDLRIRTHILIRKLFLVRWNSTRKCPNKEWIDDQAKQIQRRVRQSATFLYWFLLRADKYRDSVQKSHWLCNSIARVELLDDEVVLGHGRHRIRQLTTPW